MIGGPIGAFVGVIPVGAVGYFTGKEVAELVKSYPPIWTELELTINADATIRTDLVSHSAFPSNTFFTVPLATSADIVAGPYTSRQQYDGDAGRLKQWQSDGWDLATAVRSGPTDGNPWGMANPAGTIGEKLVQSCPAGYECRGAFL